MPWGSAGTDNSHGRRTALGSRRARYALVELGDSESIDLFLREEDARRALEEILSDEPQCQGLLRVEEIESVADQTSVN
jgi:hypothetical protein